VNRDPRTRDRLKVLFLTNYSVSLAELVMPAADVSEQVSTAETEASGTGNMKLKLNVALTVGTLDGANIEIREAVGAENFFLFGMTEEEVEAKKRSGYDPHGVYERDPVLRGVLDVITAGAYAGGDAERHRPIVDVLLSRDPFFVLEDFAAYLAVQEQVERTFADPERWARMAICNVAGMGRFSSDATIAGYAKDIWRVPVRGRAV
jgi:starch phosphorylase